MADYHVTRNWTLARKLAYYSRPGRQVPGMRDRCLEWTASLNCGYGQLNWKGRPQLASRLAWEDANGPIPPGKWICHHCDNRPCINVDHLFVGDPIDNVMDKVAKGRGRNGVSLGEKHGMAKLTAEAVHEIRAFNGFAKDIAAKLGVSTTTVYDVKKRKIWKHI